MKDILAQLLKKKFEGGGSVEIKINAPDEEKETDLAPEVKDEGQDDEALMEPALFDSDVEQGRGPMGLGERAKLKIKQKMMAAKK